MVKTQQIPVVQNLIRRLECAIAAVLLMVLTLTAQTLESGVTAYQRGDFAEAKKVFESLLKKDNNNADAHYQLGIVLFSRTNLQRSVDDAVDELEKAVDLNPNNAEYQFQYGVALGEKTRKAGVIKQAFLAPKVKNAFKRAVELNPRHAQAHIALAQFYLIAPSIVGGDEGEGWKQLEEAIKLDEVQGRIVKATFLARAKRIADAEEEYKTLLASHPHEWRIRKSYGNFFLRSEQYDNALGQFQEYVKLRPDTADSYQCLAETFLKKGDADKAENQLDKSLSIDKDFVPALITLGEVLQGAGKKQEAKETYQRAVLVAKNEYYKNQAEKKLKEIE